MKECNVCYEEKLLSEFFKDPRNGRTLLRCKVCCSLKQRECERNDPARYLVRRAKARAKRKGFKFNIAADNLLPLPKICPILGIRIRFGIKPQDPHAYSLDRLNSRKGYVKGNVAVISYLANRLKNDGTVKQHEQIAKWMRSQGLK